VTGPVRRVLGRLRPRPRHRFADHPVGDAPEITVEYSPCIDGDPDPGEVVWTWVPYEEDPNQGKDRPVVVIGRRGALLVGVPLTSHQRRAERQVAVGKGPWDRDGRTSFAKVDRLVEFAPEDMRREGAVLQRRRFDAVVAAVGTAAAPGDDRGGG
jgi:mRNA-degrading endonuclease toxin of MazEF toxin-antitoxin module